MERLGKRRAVRPPVKRRVVRLNGVGDATDEEHLETPDHVDLSSKGCCRYLGSFERHGRGGTPTSHAPGPDAKRGEEAGYPNHHRQSSRTSLHPSCTGLIDFHDLPPLQSPLCQRSGSARSSSFTRKTVTASRSSGSTGSASTTGSGRCRCRCSLSTSGA